MTGQLNYLVGLEQKSDMRRAAARSHLAAEMDKPRTPEAPKPALRTSRGLMGLRRRPKVA
jgi:hypothetical protein